MTKVGVWSSTAAAEGEAASISWVEEGVSRADFRRCRSATPHYSSIKFCGSGTRGERGRSALLAHRVSVASSIIGR